jgi:hypothetical protein
VLIAAIVLLVLVAGSFVGTRLAGHHSEGPQTSPAPTAPSVAPPTQVPSPTPSPPSPSPTPSPTTPAPPVTPPKDFAVHANQGERLAVTLSGITFPHGVVVEVLDPAGRSVSRSRVRGPRGFVDAVFLPAPGDYTVRVAAANPTERGEFDARLYSVPPDATGEITPYSIPVTIANTAPWQNMRLRFDGSAGQRISVNQSNIEMSRGVYVSVLAPDGTVLTTSYAAGPNGYTDTIELPVDGRYTVLIDPRRQQVGPVTVTMHDLPPDPTAAVEAGSEPVTLEMFETGQNGSVTFAGRAGQAVRLELSPITVPDGVEIRLVAPDGTALGTSFVPAPGGTIGPITLQQDGTYTAVVNPQSDRTGTVTVRLFAAGRA